jgi:hypothetical protein
MIALIGCLGGRLKLICAPMISRLLYVEIINMQGRCDWNTRTIRRQPLDTTPA